MPLIILQPFGDKDGQKHFMDTVEMKVPIDTMKKFIAEPMLSAVKSYYSSNEVAAWGVTPGVNDVNIKKWNRVQPGDLVLFSANKKIRGIGTVAFKFHSKEAAKTLWGYNQKNQTWEYMYLLDELQNVDIEIEKFNEVVGYAKNYIIQGFNVLDEEKSEKFLAHFEMFSDKIIEDVSEDEYNETLDEFDTLDKKVLTSARKEQQFLRKKLFNNHQTFKCGICNKTYPVAFLVASHIKMRSLCTLDEQKDWKNIVMPMCKFGCDDLYEKGYIGVEDGIVKVLKNDSTDLKSYLKLLDGNKCDYWNSNTKIYFEYHKNQNK